MISSRELNLLFYGKGDNVEGKLKDFYAKTEMIWTRSDVPRYSRGDDVLIPNSGELRLTHFRNVLSDSGAIALKFPDLSPEDVDGNFSPRDVNNDGNFTIDKRKNRHF